MLTPMQAAKIACQSTDWQLSNLQVQKILYLAHMWQLFTTQGASPLIQGEPFEAWDYGPVVPQLYHELRMFGSKPIQNIFRLVQIDGVDLDEKHLLSEFAKYYGNAKAGTLVRMTHRANGAWDKNYIARANCQIPDADIYQEALDRDRDRKVGGQE